MVSQLSSLCFIIQSPLHRASKDLFLKETVIVTLLSSDSFDGSIFPTDDPDFLFAESSEALVRIVVNMDVA